MDSIKYPDIASAEVGQEVCRVTRVSNRVQIAKFAGATRDYNPIHVDDEAGKKAGLGGVIGHGLLTMGMASQMVTDWLGGDPALMKKIGVRFSKVVKPGDNLTMTAVLSAKEKSSDAYKARLELLVANQNTEKILSGWAEVVIPGV